jgi:uncharacterized membrane protein
MSLAPAVVIHMSAALGALAIGPVALWARQGAKQRSRLHRSFGYAWVTLMVITAVSALFVHGSGLPNIAGFSPVHLLVPLTLFGLYGSFQYLARGNVARHRRIMQLLYWGACVITFFFTLLPDRYLGRLLWGQLDLVVDRLFNAEEQTMLISMLIQQPQMFASVIRATPIWVWGLLAALIALGLSQARARSASRARIAIMPLAMTAFAVWGMFAAFGSSPLFGDAVLVWLFAASTALALVAPMRAPRGTSFDATTRSFALPGSWVPMVLILAIFLVKYVVGVDLAMQPTLARDMGYTLMVAGLYGLSSGVFAGRAARLLRLSLDSTDAPVPPLAA